jgi:hypothetical protein
MQAIDDLQNAYDSAIDDAKHKISKQYADKFVLQFKSMLAQFNLKNHTVLINSGMGSCCITIKNNANGKEIFLHDLPRHHSSYVWDELRLIEANLDWEWCYNLDRVTLN